MAVVFKDGFDWYVSADILKRWTSFAAGGSASVGPLYSRQRSGQGLLVQGGAAAFPYCLGKNFGSNYTQGLYGFAVYFATSTTSARIVASVGDGTSEQISVRLNSSGILTISRNGTLLATGTTVLSQNTWYFIELKFVIHNTTGSYGLHLNGGVEIADSAANQNTRTTANNQWNAVGLGQAAITQVATWYDDLYVLDTSTGSNTNYLGPVRMFAAKMVAPGNYAQWTSNGGTNFGNVSEDYQDGDVSFNQSSTPNQIDTFIVGDLPAGSGNVYAVEPILVARQDSGSARTIAPLLRIGGADYAGTAVGLSTSYQFLGQIYDVQPVGGNPAWDVSTFNAMEAGYKEIT